MVEKKIPKKLEQHIKAYTNVLQKDSLPITKVILFGSFAKGTQHKWSDVDVAIISPKFTNRFEALHYLNHRTINKEPYYIEAHGFAPEDFDNKYDSLIHEIKTHGVEIKI
jgi:predicted nucleotidyltransferase